MAQLLKKLMKLQLMIDLSVSILLAGEPILRPLRLLLSLRPFPLKLFLRLII